jgi:hypothetical protein
VDLTASIIDEHDNLWIACNQSDEVVKLHTVSKIKKASTWRSGMNGALWSPWLWKQVSRDLPSRFWRAGHLRPLATGCNHGAPQRLHPLWSILTTTTELGVEQIWAGRYF